MWAESRARRQRVASWWKSARKMRAGGRSFRPVGEAPGGGRFGRGGHRAPRSRGEAGFVVGRFEPQSATQQGCRVAAGLPDADVAPHTEAGRAVRCDETEVDVRRLGTLHDVDRPGAECGVLFGNLCKGHGGYGFGKDGQGSRDREEVQSGRNAVPPVWTGRCGRWSGVFITPG